MIYFYVLEQHNNFLSINNVIKEIRLFEIWLDLTTLQYFLMFDLKTFIPFI